MDRWSKTNVTTICPCDHGSLDSSILNSPSSAHRLQTLRKKSPFDCPPCHNHLSAKSPRLSRACKIYDNRTISPSSRSTIDSVTEITNLPDDPNSSNGSVLYLSDCCLSEYPCQETKKPADNYLTEARLRGINSKSQHSIAYYLSMPRLDRFFNWTRIIFRLALFVLPIIWIIVAISWIVYLKSKDNNNLFEVNPDELEKVKSINETMEQIAIGLTMFASVLSALFVVVYVIKSHWAYSFEFIPNEDEEIEVQQQPLTSNKCNNYGQQSVVVEDSGISTRTSATSQI